MAQVATLDSPGRSLQSSRTSPKITGSRRSPGEGYVLRLAIALLLFAVSLESVVLGAERSPEAALAQLSPDGAPGIVSAAALRPIESGVAYSVRTYDDADLDLEIRQALERRLQETDRELAPDGPLLLDIATEVIPGNRRDSEPSLGNLRAGKSSVQLNMNVWSSSKDSLLGGRQEQSSGSRPNVFHINAVLRDSRTGTVLWEGNAFAEMLTTDTRRIALSMVGPLVDSLGRTVRNEPFQIE